MEHLSVLKNGCKILVTSFVYFRFSLFHFEVKKHLRDLIKSLTLCLVSGNERDFGLA